MRAPSILSGVFTVWFAIITPPSVKMFPRDRWLKSEISYAAYAVDLFSATRLGSRSKSVNNK